MFKINNIKANADKLYSYLSDRIEKINESLKDREDLAIERFSLERNGSRITLLERSSKSRRNGSGRTLEVLDLDCKKLDLYSSFMDIRNVEYHDFVLFDLFELFKQGIIEDENVVFVVFGDVSTELYSVEYFVKGIFTDLDRALLNIDDSFDHIVATKLDEVNDFYVGGYTE